MSIWVTGSNMTIVSAIFAGLAQGLQVTLDKGLEMMVLHPGVELVSGTDADANNNSVVT